MFFFMRYVVVGMEGRDTKDELGEAPMMRRDSILCKLLGCRWTEWTSGCDVEGRRCKRCGLWQYEDGSYLGGSNV